TKRPGRGCAMTSPRRRDTPHPGGPPRGPARRAARPAPAAPPRLLVTGGNGAGKSTLLAVLAGRLVPEGEVGRRPGLTVGMLAQDTWFARPDRTVHDTYERALGVGRAEEVPLTSLGLMHEADLDKPVGQLSVGQRRRLALALLTARPPQLLLLDEPTNHLSPRLCDELEEALGTGPGAVVLASHDRWLRRRWQGRDVRLYAERLDGEAARAGTRGGAPGGESGLL
ncbi:ATP-binding cassette domain-containing protein, partial [Streptomyces sp. NPDC059814]|uniref:ATP-binding cassette domain-containing protein n=1 Tax=Streptomyces sp. NPDC059814 TaxID=3346959 RepID=UPI00364B4DEE